MSLDLAEGLRKVTALDVKALVHFSFKPSDPKVCEDGFLLAQVEIVIPALPGDAWWRF